MIVRFMVIFQIIHSFIGEMQSDLDIIRNTKKASLLNILL